MARPRGVAVDPTSGAVFVADTFNARVLRFASTAALLNGAAADGVLGASDFTSFNIGTTASQMSIVEGVAVDNVGTLWVADPENNRVLRFDKSVQTITFAALGAKTYGDAPFAVSATGGASGLPVTFTSATPAVCTVSGNTVTLVSGGTCTIVAHQAADGNYRAAEVSQSFTVNKAAQMITFDSLPAKTVNDVAFDVSATASSGLPVSFSTSTPEICTVSGSIVTLVAAGTCTIIADQAGNASYNAAPAVSRSFICSGLVGQLSLNKRVSIANPAPGEPISYALIVHNSGGASTSFSLADVLPPQLTSAGPATITPAGSGTLGPLPVVLTNTPLAAGATLTVTIPVTVPLRVAAGMQITNTAVLTGTGASPIQSVAVFTVRDVAPVAQLDLNCTNPRSPFQVKMINNDSDPNGKPLTLVSVGTPEHGSAEVLGSAVRYTPAAGYLGPDTFTYTVSDGTLTSTGTVRLTVQSSDGLCEVNLPLMIQAP